MSLYSLAWVFLIAYVGALCVAAAYFDKERK